MDANVGGRRGGGNRERSVEEGRRVRAPSRHASTEATATGPTCASTSISASAPASAPVFTASATSAHGARRGSDGTDTRRDARRLHDSTYCRKCHRPRMRAAAMESVSRRNGARLPHGGGESDWRESIPRSTGIARERRQTPVSSAPEGSGGPPPRSVDRSGGEGASKGGPPPDDARAQAEPPAAIVKRECKRCGRRKARPQSGDCVGLVAFVDSVFGDDASAVPQSRRYRFRKIGRAIDAVCSIERRRRWVRPGGLENGESSASDGGSDGGHGGHGDGIEDDDDDDEESDIGHTEVRTWMVSVGPGTFEEDLTVTSDVHIVGQGPATTTIVGTVSLAADLTTLTLENLTLASGNSPGIAVGERVRASSVHMQGIDVYSIWDREPRADSSVAAHAGDDGSRSGYDTPGCGPARPSDTGFPAPVAIPSGAIGSTKPRDGWRNASPVAVVNRSRLCTLDLTDCDLRIESSDGFVGRISALRSDGPVSANAVGVSMHATVRGDASGVDAVAVDLRGAIPSVIGQADIRIRCTLLEDPRRLGRYPERPKRRADGAGMDSRGLGRGVGLGTGPGRETGYPDVADDREGERRGRVSAFEVSGGSDLEVCSIRVAARAPEFVGTVALARLRGRVGFFCSNSTVDMEHVDPDSRLLLEGIPEGSAPSDDGADGSCGRLPTASVLGTSFSKTDVPASVGHFDSLSVAVTDASGSLVVSGGLVSGDPSVSASARPSVPQSAAAAAAGAPANAVSASDFLIALPLSGDGAHLATAGERSALVPARGVPVVRIPRGCPSGTIVLIDRLTVVRAAALNPESESIEILLPDARSVGPATTFKIMRCCGDRMPRIEVSSTDGTPIVGGYLRDGSPAAPISERPHIPSMGRLEVTGSVTTLVLVSPLNDFGEAEPCWSVLESPAIAWA